MHTENPSTRRPPARLRILATVVALAGSLIALPALADNVENLERERAILIDTFLDPGLSVTERAARVETSQRRLVDLERLVLRDDSLTGRNTPTIRRAFNNYDLTFLVHASTEHGMSVLDQWLDQLGYTTEAILAADRKRRGQ